ncbi:latent-transforming growth factor beta-binding protein 1 isoform X1 [Brienomyrus brachyistius]|uniref:latent-transforming growth factor beta-binding protein 1 isoform X1 n=1 Tax=Brienomyrus brachyistius TaxID=42636 RepID=UPI0020B2C926|nr:latent-transforming growth factor beta-binding protein 1 isoform X1 [Brienomyrus brachyistius]
MAWLRWDILLPVWVFVSPAFASPEQSGFRRYYVLQPGMSGTLSSRAGSAAQPRSYNVELTASIGGQVRSRRMGSQANPSLPLRQDSKFMQQHQQQQTAHQIKISGINICGGQCCHGWSRAPGSQRCTKPTCQPQCQNGGMCLQPQLCVCKPGSKGKTCEQKSTASSNPTVMGNDRPNGHGVVPQHPIPQQTSPLSLTQGHPLVPHSSGAQMTLTVKQSPQLIRPQPVRPSLSRTAYQGQSQQFIVKPKYYPSLNQPVDRAIPLSGGYGSTNGGNHTGRIRVVFTPSICKMTCSGGKCQNSCEKGNTTTIISENGHAADTLTASNFRVVVCHLPCMNGGQCSKREQCQCPPTFTGKFCQLPIHGGSQKTLSISHSRATQVHSTHTLPLTFGGGQNQVKFTPSIVNIHVKHPPEASVQVHQVSQLDTNGQQVKGSQSDYTTHKGQQTHHVYPNQQTFIHHYPVTSKSTLGRCFQETTGMQCGKMLPGLSKQEDCCNSIGTSWGFHKCQKCPKKHSIPLTDARHGMDCPQGYTRINNSYCQDINECLLQGVCPNGDCLNTIGSYRCSCKAGFVPDATLTNCISDTPMVHEQEGACFRFVSSGRQCLHPLSVHLTKQLCCCSVGKAWGPSCDRCPIPGTADFKDICPGGMGYTVTGTYRPKPFNQPNMAIPQKPLVPLLPSPTVEKHVEALSITERQVPAIPVVTTAPEQELIIFGANNKSGGEPGQPQLSPGVSTIRMEPNYPEVVEKTSPPAPVAILPSSASQDIAPTQLAEVNECLLSPDICGPGICYNTPEGYICVCHDGHQLDEEKTTCQDVNECQDPNVCGQDSLCINTPGSYTCEHCPNGFRMSHVGRCEDINECLDPDICPAGMCTNTLGSFICDPCPEGFEGRGGLCVDIDECRDPSMCANGNCANLEGYFLCTCHSGYELTVDGRACADMDECQDEKVCAMGHCQNTEGSFVCSCSPGFKLSPAGNQCDDVDECKETLQACGGVADCRNNLGSYLCVCPPGYHLYNSTHCEDIDECVDDPELCGPHGKCMNNQGSFLCVCNSGFSTDLDPQTCQDVDECLGGILCSSGSCINTEGSYHCQCEQGYRLQADNSTCLDVDECEEFGQNICEGWRCENTLGSYRCRADCPPGHRLGHHGGCEDVNECELFSGLCGEAVCSNMEGSFQCVCPKENQEYDQMTAKCRPAPAVTSVERKECYYNLNDEKLCDNVLASSVTLEECCCTLGAGWGDNCEVHPCPVEGTDQFKQMCPGGKGSVPTSNVAGAGTSPSYRDADECALFSQEVCKGGFCLNTPLSYECYCKQGLFYDDVKLQCLDIDECLDTELCMGGKCINMLGSFMCFCLPPLELDHTQQRCVSPSPLTSRPPTVAHHESPEMEGIFQSTCWQKVTLTQTCGSPMLDRSTTYTECCCLYGEAWGTYCALCPRVDTEDYATMCNLPYPGVQRPYGRDALTAGDVDYYEAGPDFAPLAQNPSPIRFYEDKEEGQRTFEGLRAEECGVLNGCEHGRCVRVQDGYTCDCFDGYTLDMSHMACIDVNECSELNSRMALCKNGKCINTQGSYKCVCLPGFVPSARPNYCVAIEKVTE